MVRPGPVGGSESIAVEESVRISGRKRPVRTPPQQRSVAARREVARAPPSGSQEDDKNSCASTSHKHDDSDRHSQASDSESPPVGNFCSEEVDAASSLANIFLAAAQHSKTPQGSGKRQPLSAPAAMQSLSEDGGEVDPLMHKKQRRREKNRESAQQSRQRKKCHLEALELRVAQLESERAALQATLHSLTVENRSLKAHIHARPAPKAEEKKQEKREEKQQDEAVIKEEEEEEERKEEGGAVVLLAAALKNQAKSAEEAEDEEEAAAAAGDGAGAAEEEEEEEGEEEEGAKSALDQLAVAASLTA